MHAHRPLALSALAALSVLLVAALPSGASAQRAQRWMAGATYEFSQQGAALGATVGYALSDAVALSASASGSGFTFTQRACVAYSIDTFALLRGSFFYVGDEHREANFILAQRGEVTVGPTVSLGRRLRFEATVRAGVRWLEVETQVDEVVSEEVASRRRFYGCGDFYSGRSRPSAPFDLDAPTTLTSSAVGGLVTLGFGLSYEIYEGWRVFGHVHSRSYFYGGARFRVRDPDQAGMGSAVLRLRDHAPDLDYRVQVGLRAPLSFG